MLLTVLHTFAPLAKLFTPWACLFSFIYTVSRSTQAYVIEHACPLCCGPQGSVLSVVLIVNAATQPRELSSITHEHITLGQPLTDNFTICKDLQGCLQGHTLSIHSLLTIFKLSIYLLSFHFSVSLLTSLLSFLYSPTGMLSSLDWKSVILFFFFLFFSDHSQSSHRDVGFKEGVMSGNALLCSAIVCYFASQPPYSLVILYSRHTPV